MHTFLASLRITLATAAICVAGYTAALLVFAKAVAPDTAEGSLIVVDGQAVGSRLVAQGFTRPDYFWPRPSAVDYNGAGAGGSNKSPTSPDLTERAAGLVALHGATPERPLPAELAAASGGGLDPHLTEHAALYQADRVARARSLPLSQVENLVKAQAFSPGGTFTPDRLVNVLELNLALDAATKSP
ncbi:MAG: potassium-transporting ATPase subunit C [Opitutaceae bacterium]|nr:potassium-transporting ATPase subunit C [Cephaloticoccus sp.]MCP5529813.1 potassium-transporting ATPase subunit C [Opitutaceae bacterium]